MLTMDQMVRLEGLRAVHLDTVRAYYDPSRSVEPEAETADEAGD